MELCRAFCILLLAMPDQLDQQHFNMIFLANIDAGEVVLVFAFDHSL